ncbi:gas vesicle protein K [Saccharopolyspora rhizosphaerae]|uniref:Gas vesicle protein K n=1 Tax=Saccharopolyspora rhizosphaerae TaxID=2492662 RepID=A0A426K034_9PSEU|nr:gas vesicle protein K [Saccharopolyspora rhizosphaerae]
MTDDEKAPTSTSSGDAERSPEDVNEALSQAVQRVENRINTDKDSVERDLMKLVLTIIELLRQLMEKQALRRVEAGNLTDDQEERIGLTLMLLEDRMTELRDRYDLTPEDLNLDLGPLGNLLPR